MVDMLQTGKMGILNSQTLLNTTSNNINNVNTEGFTRKQTVTYTSTINWGVGDTYTKRIYDQYVQREMFQDQGRVGFNEAYISGMEAVDKMLTDENMSVSNAVGSYFDSLSDAVQNPTSTADREESLASLKTIVERYNNLNLSISDKIRDVNSKINDDVALINSYASSIQKANAQIKALAVSNTNVNNEIYQELLDERDRLINKLSSLVDVNVVEQSDRSLAVYMANGQLLANGENFAVLNTQPNEQDPSKLDVYLSFNRYAGSPNDNTHVRLTSKNIGGELGGYLDSTDELRQTKRDLGQMAVAFADALNVQNKAGFTLENKAGSDLLSLPVSYAQSNNANFGMQCSFNQGQGGKVTSLSFKVDFSDGALNVSAVDAEGNLTDITASVKASNDPNGNLVLTLDDYGITFKCNASEANLIGNEVVFYSQPTLDVCDNLKVNITKPEDFAFASAVRTKTATGNYGNGVISLESCTQTGANMGVSTDPNTNMPVFNAGAPTNVKIDGNGNYVVYDSKGNKLATAPASCGGKNIFANAVDANGQPLGKGIGYPGYEISITGTVKEGDSFSLEINENGGADNSNGVALAGLRTKDTVRLSSAQGALNGTFAERYADITATLGSQVYKAQTDLAASQAKCEQTQTLYNSKSGVNLDEEAANLLMYQQSYQACSKIISASQTIFDSLIGAF